MILNSRFCGVVDGRTVLALGAYDPPAGTTTEPYLMWVLIGPAGELPAHGTPPAELVRFAGNRTAGWDCRATTVLRETIVADSFLTSLRSVTEIPDIPVRTEVPVAFLGDAIHTMSPAGGEGANTALGDASLLVSHLLAAGTSISTGASTITGAVARYHADMRRTAGEALKRSASYTTREPSHV